MTKTKMITDTSPSDSADYRGHGCIPDRDLVIAAGGPLRVAEELQEESTKPQLSPSKTNVPRASRSKTIASSRTELHRLPSSRREATELGRISLDMIDRRPRSGEIVFDAEPVDEDTNKFIFMRVAPTKKGEASDGMLYFYLDITNSGPQVSLTKINVSFPGSVEEPYGFTRSVVIKSGDVTRVWLQGFETIRLIASPTKIEIGLAFEGVKDQVSKTWDLGPHEVAYPFFAKPESINNFGEYMGLKGQHVNGTGSQHWAYDTFALGWMGNKLSGSKSGNGSNVDSFTFGHPCYAMGTGRVLLAEDSFPDNQAPGKRFYMRLAEGWQGKVQVSDMAVACIRSTINSVAVDRIVIASVFGKNPLKLTLLEHSTSTKSITLLTEASGGAGGAAVRAVSLDGKKWIVVLTQIGTNALVKLWEVTPDAKFVERDSFSSLNTVSMKVLPLTSSRLVSAAKSIDGTLNISVRQLNGDSFSVLDSASIGLVGSAFDLVTLDDSRFVSATQTKQGNLRLVAWRLTEKKGGVFKLVQTGDLPGEMVSEIVGLKIDTPGHFATVVRLQDKTMSVKMWKADPISGVIKFSEEFKNDISSSMLNAANVNEKAVVATFRTDSGHVHLSVIKISDDGIVDSVLDDSQETVESTNFYCVGKLRNPTSTLVTVLRTAMGTPNVILWQFTGNNIMKIFYEHTKEIVMYAHFKQGSIPAKFKTGNAPLVAEGELIGLMGNAGTSSGPHLHIQADRVRSKFLGNIAILRDLVVAQVDISVPRPLQFQRVKAMDRDLDVKKGGIEANPLLADMDGHGAYFEDYVAIRSV